MAAWIDMHAHLDKLGEGPEAALNLALEAGVQRLITIGTEPADHAVVLGLAKKYQPYVYCTLGVHPHEGTLYTPEAERFMDQNLQDPRVVAVGEIGLDYYYDSSPRDCQQQAFRAQLEIAKKHKMPVEIHTRDAEQDTVAILREFQGDVGGLIHCFTGTDWLARQVLDLGYHISISGVVTFKNAQALRDIVKWLPLDRLHVETDAPFLTPVPLRGKPNTPAFVVHTAALVAQIKGVSLDELAHHTQNNAQNLFKKLVF